MTPGAAAQCAIHPAVSASRTCARCGNFMCADCSGGGAETQCPRCRALGVSFPFSRTNRDFGAMWDFAWEAFKREWVMLSIGVLIMGAALFGVSIVVQVFQSIGQAIAGKSTTALVVVFGISQVVNMLLQALVLGVFWMGFTRMVIDVLQGKKADLARLFSELPKLGAYMAQWVLSFLMFDLPALIYFGGVIIVAIRSSGHTLPSFDNPKAASRELVEMMLDIAPMVVGGWLIALIPLWWIFLARQMIVPEMVYGGAAPFEAISRAFRLASGARITLLGAFLIGIVLTIIGFIACCIGILPAVAMFSLLTTTLYLALRNGSELPPPRG